MFGSNFKLQGLKDFTLPIYKEILKIVFENGYSVKTFSEYLDKSIGEDKIIVLRHDIDRLSKHIIHFAEFEQEHGVKASYYFPAKIIKGNPNLIREISEMDHEVGYHYNDLSLNKGNRFNGIESFKKNLNLLHEIETVTSICMDGRPYQKYDNRKLWDHYDFKDLGILGEIYLDIDYNEFAYYTDTGRKWNNKNINVRDKVVTNKEWPVYKSTFEMIEAIKNGTFPKKAVINIHPEHWTDNAYDWTKKLVWQSFKNFFKFILIKVRRLKEGR